MQVRAYFTLVRRFWMLIVLLPILAGGLSLVWGLRQPVRYQATVRLMVARTLLDTERDATMLDLNENYAWTTTEFVLDDLPLVVGSATFAQDVRDALAALGYDLPTLQGSLQAEVLHRSVLLSAVADTPDLAVVMLQQAVEMLRTNGLAYWGRTPGELDIAILDPPQAAGSVGGLRTALINAALRAALALAVAVGLALLIAYLDDRLYTSDQAEAWTGYRLLASIPKE